MDRPCQFFGEDLIDGPLACNPVQAHERGTDNGDRKVGLANARRRTALFRGMNSGASMASVACTFVQYFKD